LVDIMLNRHVFIYLFGHGVPAFFGFIALIVFTHIIDPSEYGIYVIGTSIAGIVSMAFFGWIRLSVSRYQAATEKADLRAVILVSYASTLAVASVTFVLLLLVMSKSVDQVSAGLIFIFVVCLSAFEISQELRRALFKPIIFTAAAATRSIVALVLGVAVIKAGWGGLGLLASTSFSFLAANALFAWPIWGRRFQLKELQLTRKFVQYGMPLAVSGLVFAFYAAFDRLAVAYLLGQEAAGRYGVASDLARQMIGVVAASVGAAVSPIAFRTMVAGKDATRDHLNKSLELLLALVAPVAVWLVICSDVLAGTIVGAQYGPTVALLLPLLAIARLFGAVTNFYVHISYQLAERPLLQLMNDSSILLLYLVLMVPLTLRFGLMGAAGAALGAELVGLLFGLALARRGFQLPFAPNVLMRISLSLAFMAVATYVAKSAIGGPDWARLVNASIAGGAAYGTAVFALDIGGIRGIITTRWHWLKAALRPQT
jgi:O-antigen/teichoic acid export membrane protein